MTGNRPAVEVATAFIEAFGAGDLATIGECLAEDVVFESPRIQVKGVAAVTEVIGRFSQVVAGVDIIAALGDAEQAMVIYDMRTGPFGTLRVVDHLIVRDGRITSDVVVFDTYEMRKAEEAAAG
ncbi:nuclear transport factor 2 family protein [Nonomuraea sp. NN258]|uniref:nuclear transport factor 2 family protein n=1 Tax=Nonomuraea antri TaxID=2730852 RepID=UPI00156A28F5|nr:nuclear transport factor 2 family protein [Nonomuraea antri]NRQ31867.1 nuclear transport factor 2 family protein [Nonomuraea antri]